MTEHLHQPLAITVLVPIGASDDERRAAVLRVLERYGLSLADVGASCQVRCVERLPERRVHASMSVRLAEGRNRGGGSDVAQPRGRQPRPAPGAATGSSCGW